MRTSLLAAAALLSPLAYADEPTAAQREQIVDLTQQIMDALAVSFAFNTITRLADDYLPRPRILHPWPEQRFAVKHPR